MGIKTLGLSLIVAMLVTTGVAAAQEITINSLQLRYKYDYAVIEKYRIGMEAVIGYVDELGKNSSALIGYKDQFTALTADLKAAADNNDEASYNATIEEMKAVVSNFRHEARNQVGNNTEEARARIEAALEENEDYLYGLVTEARELHKERNTQIFDYYDAKAREVINRLEAQGYNMSEAKAKLSEIEEKRESFIDAMNTTIQACSDKWIGECKETPEAESYFELRDEIIADFRDLRDLILKIVLDTAIPRAEDVLIKAENVLSRAEAKGIDVTTEKAKLDAIKSLINDAKAKHEQGAYKEAIGLLKSAKDSFRELKEEVRARRGEV